MFFIFGWGHSKVKEYGPVEQEKCENCHNTDIWQLKKNSKFFTLFFVPVFPYESESFYHCPICNYGRKLDREYFESYKTIAAINTDCLEKRITEEERLQRLDEIHKVMKERSVTNNLKDIEDSKKWAEAVSERSSEELQLIIDQKSGEYNPGYIIAARLELEKRGVRSN